VPGVSISVIVRVRDEADALNLCLELIGAQTGAGAGAEVIVVDNGSVDGSGAVARRHGAEVVSISPERFSYGAALNLGASLAHGSVRVALSAHAFVRASDWLERISAPFSDPTVACVCGERYWPDGSLLRRPVRYDARLARGYPRWGYSNAAGAFRAQLWEQRPFREDLPAAEDREWGRHWALTAGLVSLLDPGLLVEHDHTHDPPAAIFSRARREAAGLAAFLPEADLGRPRPLLAEWFSDTRFYDSAWRARASPRRAARLLGERVGRRAR
jgi:glycosyltransferase involved in cell wall biosynthesis